MIKEKKLIKIFTESTGIMWEADCNNNSFSRTFSFDLRMIRRKLKKHQSSPFSRFFFFFPVLVNTEEAQRLTSLSCSEEFLDISRDFSCDGSLTDRDRREESRSLEALKDLLQWRIAL